MLSPVVRLLGDVVPQTLRLRAVLPGRTRTESFEEPATRRGIFQLGPVLHLQSDLVGFFRRTRLWGGTNTLWVRPRVDRAGRVRLGGVFDLEGRPSDKMSMSDLAFHALREYARGRHAQRALAIVRQGRHVAGAAVPRVAQPPRSIRRRRRPDGVRRRPRSSRRRSRWPRRSRCAPWPRLRGGDVACGPRVMAPASVRRCSTSAATTRSAQHRTRDPHGGRIEVAQRSRQMSRGGPAIGVGVVLQRFDLRPGAAARGLDHVRRRRPAHHRSGGPRRRGAVRAVHRVRWYWRSPSLEHLPRLAAWVSA